MKRLLLFLAFLTGTASVQGQTSTPRRLAYLCKVWGYLKYHHPATCSVPWNNLLLARVDSVVNAPSDAAFNAILLHLCQQAGTTTAPVGQVPIPADSAKNYNIAWFQDPALAPAVRDCLDSVAAHYKPETTGCLVRPNNYSNPSYSSFIDMRRDTVGALPGFSYSNLRHRMLVYFHYWNVIRYLHPQIDLADTPWDSTLVQLMPAMMAAANDSAFELTLGRVIARIDDSHGVYSSRSRTKFINGIDLGTQAVGRLRLSFMRIGTDNVVTASGEPGIKAGDVVTKIDGLPADSFLNRWKPYFAASNAITLYRNLYNQLIFGVLNTGSRSFELVDATNVPRQVTVPFASTYNQYLTWYNARIDSIPTWTVLDCNYGYVNMGKLLSGDVAAMYGLFQNLPALVFDLRNYPNGTLWDLKQLLFPAPDVSARYLVPYLPYPGYYTAHTDSLNFGTWVNQTPYSGKVIILVNEETQSQAEYTAQALRTFPNAVIFGSQTAGADGNISEVTYPGGLLTRWTSLGWYQADGYNPQRAGVRIDTVVRPTLAGIRAGADEVLKRATMCPLAVAAVASAPVFQVITADGQLRIRGAGNEPYSVTLLDATGRRVWTADRQQGDASWSTAAQAPGVYLVLISGRTGMQRPQRVVFE